MVFGFMKSGQCVAPGHSCMQYMAVRLCGTPSLGKSKQLIVCISADIMSGALLQDMLSMGNARNNLRVEKTGKYIKVFH